MTKKYKCRVEYLESTGTQYIDTEYVMTSGHSSTFNGNIMWTQNAATANFFYGYRSVNSATYEGDMRAFFIYGASPAGRLAIRYGVNTDNSTSVAVSLNQKYNISWDGDNLKVNGTTYATLTQAYTPANYKNMWLFWCNCTGYYSSDVGHFVGRIYNWQIFDNDVLVRDFIPVLDNSGRPAMYDQVSGQLFYNQGTGEFTYGRQIIPVEYLESTGTQYIDTGFKGKNNLHYKTKVNFTTLSTGGSNGIGGEYLANASAYIGMVRANGHYTYLFNNTAVETTTTIYANTDYEIDSVMDSGNQVLKVNGETISTGTISGTFTSTRNIFLYAICSTNEAADVYGSLKMYYCQIYDNDTLVRDFIPCIDENLTPFMFDKVNGTVYLNAGTGQFKVGPNVEKVWGGKKLRRKLALALANLKKPRKYYCEVEYLEGTGTQYIDTGIKSSANVSVKTKFNLSDISAKAMFGSYSGPSSNGVGVFFGTAGGNLSGKVYCNNTNVAVSPDLTLSTNTDYEIEMSGTTLTVNGSDYTSATTADNNYNMILFARSNNGTVERQISGKIYYLIIKDNDTLIRDLIPVLDWNMTPCMYDRVTDQLFYNAGSGNFTAGREIHQVEYIETDGTSYINTGYIPSGSTETEITTMLKDQTNSRFMFGCRSAQSNKTYACLAHNQNRIGYRVGDGSYLYSNGYNELDTKHTYKIANGVFYRDDVVINTACQGVSVSPNSPLSLLTINTNNVLDVTQPFIGNLYSCTIKDNNVLVRDYIPAIDENGVGFMFDRVTHTIYDNAGTGAFKYPAREVEYLQSDGARAIVAGVTIDDTCGYDVKWMALNANDTIILGTKGAGDSRWVLSGNNNPNVNISWNTSSGGVGLGLNKIQTAQMNYFNDRKRILNDTPLTDITQTLSANASTYSVGIFGGYWGASSIGLYSTCRIYYAKISKGTGLIRDFVPMVKDGSPCLYDNVGGSYYFGTGTGTFSVGKIVEPEYE